MVHVNVIERARQTIEKHSMLAKGDSVLIGLSGGPDSICLFLVLQALVPGFDLTLHALYVDHNLRPRETPDEIAFCRKLCEARGVPFTAAHVDVSSHAKHEKMTRQEAARALRYQAFDSIARQIGAQRVALGHTADDQVETVLMRLFRGSGPSGLAGIPPKRAHIIRPLIDVTRRDIEEFLNKERVSFITDSSNLRDDYMRNRLRHHLLPVIRRLSPEAERAIVRTAEIFRDEERYFDIQVTKTLMRLISRKREGEIELFLAPLEALDTVILRRVVRRAVDEILSLQGISLGNIEDIIALVRTGGPGHRLHLPGAIRVIKSYATLIITSRPAAQLSEHVLEGPGVVRLMEAALVVTSRIRGIDEVDDYGDGKGTALLDADKLSFPVLIRRRKPGDFFHPLGMGMRKKIQDLFVDEKIPRDERDVVPLLTSKGDIAWVIGYRVDERFKIDKSTKRVLECKVNVMNT